MLYDTRTSGVARRWPETASHFLIFEHEIFFERIITICTCLSLSFKFIFILFATKCKTSKKPYTGKDLGVWRRNETSGKWLEKEFYALKKLMNIVLLKKPVDVQQKKF